MELEICLSFLNSTCMWTHFYFFYHNGLSIWDFLGSISNQTHVLLLYTFFPSFEALSALICIEPLTLLMCVSAYLCY